MDNADVDLINAVLKLKGWLQVLEDITLNLETGGANGSIQIPTAKEVLLIDITISDNFPLGPISFFCKNLQGYEHEMPDGQLCLVAAPAILIADRLELELEKLYLWIKRYYIEEHNDKHFDYYHFANAGTPTLIFEEDAINPFLSTNYGKFKFSILRPISDKSKDQNTWIALTIGGRKCKWSETFLKVLNEIHIGLWVYTKQPPLIQRRQTMRSWKELLKLLTAEQTKYIYDEHLKVRPQAGLKEGFFLALGYDIPADGGMEIHWENIFIPYNEFPYTPLKENGHYYPVDIGYNVRWCKTLNASYDRVFGRGKLADELCNSRILLLGTGAIGSNLLDLLVRGGVRFLHFHDGEQIEPGNVCRGRFSFTQTNNYKVGELFYEAIRVSPFVELDLGFDIKALRKDHKDYLTKKEDLSKYDYIFDCSTDKYLSLMLDQMQLPGCVINISISNEAKQMAVITGIGNIHKIKSDLYNRFSDGSPKEPFFVAQGCWHPTFKASLADISLLTSYVLNEINLRLENGLPVRSFYIQKEITTGFSLNYTINYHV